MGSDDLILRLLLCALPAMGAGIAHMAVVTFDLWPALKIPLDGGRSWRGKRLLGDNKTVRGLVSMVLFSILFCYLLAWLTAISPAWARYTVLDFEHYSPALYGVLYGLGYTLFELPNSFLKRRREIAPGMAGGPLNILLDHSDSVMGCLLFLYPFARFDPAFIAAGVLFFTALHIAVDYLLFLLRLREQPL